MEKQMSCLLHHTQRQDTSQYYNLDVPTRQSNENELSVKIFNQFEKFKLV